ncbi:hypothetical protein LCGC14_0429090 [marine sediment metagenome]|uniref:Terminase large subunit gp17-like C-terminal domain-containing protein n=1 Tax=marine sediment metagenome TaxID=412755 RepID=A0A0F9VAQ0_9ZZZZ
MLVIDPIQFQKKLWPSTNFYDKQRETIYSVRDDQETVVPAGNMLGKDYVAAFIVIWFFLSRHPCRIVTTSAKDDHLRVLWGEIHRFITSSEYPLDHNRGGPLVVNQRELRKVVKGEPDGFSYAIGMVASPERSAAFQGHHVARTGDGVPRTLFVVDEASSVPDEYYKMASTWASRILIIGNPWPCDNFFRHAVEGKPGTEDKGGNIRAKGNCHYERRIIKIKAVDSPNVRLALAQIRNGKKPTGEIIIPGVKPYDEYLKNKSRWDNVQRCVSLEAEFYKGAEVLLFPPEWLNEAERLARNLGNKRRMAKTIGVDPAEGGDDTVMIAMDDLGVIEMVSKKTPNTWIIVGEVIAFMKKHGVGAENVLFDRGGGGKQIADALRAKGYNVRTVHFGESAVPEKKRGMTILEQRKLNDETKAIYKNRRAQMYGLTSLKLDPSVGSGGFAIPVIYTELRRQMAPVPRTYDEEGRLWLLPKRNKDPKSDKPTMISLLGCSPDEMDALVLGVFGLVHKQQAFKVQSMV